MKHIHAHFITDITICQALLLAFFFHFVLLCSYCIKVTNITPWFWLCYNCGWIGSEFCTFLYMSACVNDKKIFYLVIDAWLNEFFLDISTCYYCYTWGVIGIAWRFCCSSYMVSDFFLFPAMPGGFGAAPSTGFGPAKPRTDSFGSGGGARYGMIPQLLIEHIAFVNIKIFCPSYHCFINEFAALQEGWYKDWCLSSDFW